MMSTPKISPKIFSYSSLQAILPYMDPNLRFSLATRFPSFRSIHRSSPVHAKFVYFGPYFLTVDKDTYKFYLTNDDDHNYSERDMTSLLGRLEIQNELLNPVPQVDRSLHRDHRLPAKYRHNNVSMDLPRETDIYDQLRKLIRNFFGINHISIVRKLQSHVGNGILQIPIGLKLQVQEVVAVCDKDLQIERILVNNTLQKIEFCADSASDVTLQNPLIKNCKHWVVHGSHQQEPWLEFIKTLDGSSVNFKNAKISHHFLLILLLSWVENPKMLGTRLSCFTDRPVHLIGRVRDIAGSRITSASIGGKVCIVTALQLDDTRELVVYPYYENGFKMFTMRIESVGSAELLE